MENKLNEKSISQKIRDNKDLINFITKGKPGSNNIRTLAIFTAFNPDGELRSIKDNRKDNSELKKYLKSAGVVWIPVLGNYGNPEESIAAVNIGVDFAKKINGKYEQESFVFTELSDEGVIHYFYEKKDKGFPYHPVKNDYVVKDVSDKYELVSDSDDVNGFTLIGKNFRYKILFANLRNVNEGIIRNFNDELGRKPHSLFENSTIDKEVQYSIKGTGMSWFYHRHALYKGLYD